jgi:hypothetical protein
MGDDERRRQLIATLRARLYQQASRGALASVLRKRAARLERERQELVDDYAQRHASASTSRRPWWKFWRRNANR